MSLLAACGSEPASAEPQTGGGGSSTGFSQGGSTDGSTGCAFNCDDDGGSSPAGCDPLAQDCDDGQKCLPYSVDGDETWNGTTCAEVSPDPKQLGEDCTAPGGPVGGQDDCDVGLMCWNVPPGQTEGVCAALCSGSAAAPVCASDQGVCAVYNDGNLPICLPTCDPLGQDCPDGQVCIPQGGGEQFVCAFDAAPNSGAYGDPCLAFNKCDPGLFCAPSSAVPGCTEVNGCCTQFCDLSVADPDAQCAGAPDGQECVPWSDEGSAPGYENLGACVLP